MLLSSYNLPTPNKPIKIDKIYAETQVPRYGKGYANKNSHHTF